MGNRIASTTVLITVTQDQFVLSATSGQSTTTLPGDAVPLSTVVNLTGPADNTIAIPAKAAGVTMEFPAGSINPKLLKGVAGDTGVVIGPDGACSFKFPQTSMNNLVIRSQVNETITLIWQ